MLFPLTEYGLIRRLSDFPDAANTLQELYLPDNSFESLKNFIVESETDALLGFFLQKGRECIRVKNYVGLLETTDGTQIEILPKALTVQQARSTLLRMLRYLREGPFRLGSTVHTSASRLPLWEVFITLFLDEVAPLLSQGLRKAYVSESANRRFLKGKLALAEHLRQNALHAERFAVTYQERTPNVPQNRLLKSALLMVQQRSQHVPNQSRIRQFLFALDDIPPSDCLPDDLRAVQTANRLYARYQSALQWAEALLSGRAFGVSTGRYLNLALLFPMERVFEDYVAAGFRRYMTEGEVTLQESSQHLIEDHSGSKRFKLRPDIILRQNEATTVLDTKWKRIDPSLAAGTYGIDGSDLYQLYAYGKKYGATQLVLIYPATETFRTPLQVFGYDETMHLRVVPFDLTQPLADEVQKVMTNAK